MENSVLKHSKKKQFGKLNSLTSVESLKTPKIRRKSLGTILPTPDLNKKPLDLNRRKSIASAQIPKNTKKRKVSEHELNTFEETISIVQDDGLQVNHSFTDLLTPKKANKRRQSNNAPLTTPHSKKNNIQPNYATPLVLAPAKEETQPGHLVLVPKRKKKIQQNHVTPLVLAPAEVETKQSLLVVAPKSSKKSTITVPKLKLQDKGNSKINANIDLEKQFNIKSEDVENAVTGVIKFASNNPHLQNQLFNEEIPLFLQINSFKIPKTNGRVKQLYRIPMKHSILPSDADICLIVPDVKGIKNNEHEKHLEHYENLLRAKDVTGIKKIMTFHEFRTEYDTFELKHRLVDLYDTFLVDGRISGKVVNKCGNIFYKKRKVPIAIKLHLPKLKPHIDQALKKAFIHLNVKSDSHMVQIGYSKSTTKNLVQNVYSVVEFLDKDFPGKMDNIRSLNVYAHRGSSIPIYISLKNPNEINLRTLTNKKPKAYKAFSGELTTQYNANVVVKPSGHVIVKRSKARQNDKSSDDNITDVEILRENKKVDQMNQQNGDGETTGKKGGKKRKLSELGSNQKVISKEINTVLFEQTGSKKKKIKKHPVKQEIIDNGVGQSKLDKKKKQNNIENVTANTEGNNVTIHKIDNKKKILKNKFKKKRSVSK